MTDKNFFNESLQQSAVKSAIVSKYFWAWAKVIMQTAKRLGTQIAYLDLFLPVQDATATEPSPRLS
jgi:hypothetical protein